MESQRIPNLYQKHENLWQTRVDPLFVTHTPPRAHSPRATHVYIHTIHIYVRYFFYSLSLSPLYLFYACFFFFVVVSLSTYDSVCVCWLRGPSDNYLCPRPRRHRSFITFLSSGPSDYTCLHSTLIYISYPCACGGIYSAGSSLKVDVGKRSILSWFYIHRAPWGATNARVRHIHTVINPQRAQKTDSRAHHQSFLRQHVYVCMYMRAFYSITFNSIKRDYNSGCGILAIKYIIGQIIYRYSGVRV